MTEKNKYPDYPVLLIDDEVEVLKAESSILKFAGIDNIITCSNSNQVMEIVAKEKPELILLDLAMPGVSGREILAMVRDEYPETAVIIVTASDDIKNAIECMKGGAADYMVKAVEKERLISGVKNVLEINSLKRDYMNLKSRFFISSLKYEEAFSDIITCSRNMKKIFSYSESIARSSETVFISGETGTGKELLANAIHIISGRDGEMVTVNTAGLDDSVFADTLFGHRKGAYTGALESRGGLVQKATDGTLFLDEIGDLSLSSQVKLLRLLDQHEYYPMGSDVVKKSDARFIVATNRSMKKMVEEGSFRKDLYYRLSTHEISIPPLRERKDDIKILLNYFLDAACDELGKTRSSYPPQLETLLENYFFPGNVREIRSMVYDAVSCQKGNMLCMESFREAIGKRESLDSFEHSSVFDCGLSKADKIPTLHEADWILIDEALKRSGGNQTIAAGMLGITKQALSKRLQRREGGE